MIVMVVNLVVYNNYVPCELLDATRAYFDTNSKDAKVKGNTVWLNNMYIKFSEQVITINIFDLKSSWQDDLNEYMRVVFTNESLFVSANNRSEYFEEFTDLSSIEAVCV